MGTLPVNDAWLGEDYELDGATDGTFNYASSGHTGAGGFTNGGGSTWILGWHVYPTDFNADGRMDLLLYNPSTGVWYQARNLVTGTFTYTTGLWLPDWVVIVRNPLQ